MTGQISSVIAVKGNEMLHTFRMGLQWYFSSLFQKWKSPMPLHPQHSRQLTPQLAVKTETIFCRTDKDVKRAPTTVLISV